jgi:hypothetical protein
MPTIEIDGLGRFEVGSQFDNLTPEQQDHFVSEMAADAGRGIKSSLGGKPKKAAAPAQMPAFDAMGNATGSTMDVAAPTSMPYGEQMANAGQFIGTTANNAARLAANGATFGLADKAAGGLDALTGQAASYDEGVKAQRARTQELRDANPVASGLAEAAGGLAGGVGLMKNGATLAGRVGGKLIPRILGYGTEGAAYGAAHGAGNTYSDDIDQYLQNAKSGALSGAVIGSALPAAGSAAGAIVRNLPSLTGSGVPGLGIAGNALLRSAARADAPGLLNLSGDTAMLVDAGPAMTGLGQGAATGTGPGRSALVNTLTQRDASTGQRLARNVDDILGPAPVPSQVEAGLADSRKALSPAYEKVLENAKAVDTAPLADSLDAAAANVRGPALKAIRDVRGMLDIPGAPGNLDPHPRALLATRHAIDGMMAKETDTNVLRVLTNARKAIDAEATRAIPGLKPVDAQFEELSRQSEGLQRGGQIFDGGKTAIRPMELGDELAAGTQPTGGLLGPSGQAFQMRQGARADLDRIVGTNVNDLNALERTLGTPQDWNAQKLGQMFGEDKRSDLVGILNQERNQRQAYQNIVQGSQTGQRSASARAMEGSDNVPLDTTMTGIGGRAAQAVARMLVGASREGTKNKLGEILALQGPDAIRAAHALLERDIGRQEASRIMVRALGPEWIGLIGSSQRPSGGGR